LQLPSKAKSILIVSIFDLSASEFYAFIISLF
jgi:hypothetical protein